MEQQRRLLLKMVADLYQMPELNILPTICLALQFSVEDNKLTTSHDPQVTSG